MTKNQKMLLGAGAVAVVGYLVYQQMNKSKGFNGQIFAPSAPSSVFANLTAAKRAGGCVNGIRAVFTPPVGGYGQGSTTFYDCKTGRQIGSAIGNVKL